MPALTYSTKPLGLRQQEQIQLMVRVPVAVV